MEPTFIQGAGGVPIATWELGDHRHDPPRRDLLVAHATGFHTGCYRALAEGLGERFRVVGFDCRGHGHSGTPPLRIDGDGRVPAMDWGRFADDALAVVDALGIVRPVAFGHSCGGAVLLLAEQRRPGTFSAIYAYEPIVGPPRVWARMGERGDPSGAALRRRQIFASRAAALEHFSSKPPLSSLRGDVLVDYVEGGFSEGVDGAVSLRCVPAAEAATYVMAGHTDAWARLGEVACAVTVGCGGAGGAFGLEEATAVAGRLQHGRVDAHPDLGHLGPFENPEEISEAVGGAFAGY